MIVVTLNSHQLIGIDPRGETCTCGHREMHIVEHFAELVLAAMPPQPENRLRRPRTHRAPAGHHASLPLAA